MTTWLAFETDIHQSPTLRARVARALDRYGLGTSDIVVDEALDYLIHKELGAAARYFNHAGKAQFNQQQITHAVLSFMADQGAAAPPHRLRHSRRRRRPRRRDPRHHPRQPPARHQPHCAPTNTPPAVTPSAPSPRWSPSSDRELYDLWLAIRDNGQRGEPGTLARLHAYAARHGIGLSGVYARMDRLARHHPAAPVVRRSHRPLPPAPPGSVARGRRPPPARVAEPDLQRRSANRRRLALFETAGDSRRPQAPRQRVPPSGLPPTPLRWPMLRFARPLRADGKAD